MNNQDDSTMNLYLKFARESKTAPGDNNPYINDVDYMANIDRPTRCYIKNSNFSTDTLFGTWGEGDDSAVSDFRIDANSFDVADYDGDSDMPYILQKDSIIIFYNDFIRHGKIVYLDKDSLAIKWRGYNDEYVQKYIRW